MNNRDSLPLPLPLPAGRRRRGSGPRRAAFAASFALTALTALSGCGGGADDAVEELTVVGNRGAVEFTATPLAAPAEGSNAFRLALFDHDSRARLEGVALRIHVMMPAMGHQPSAEPEVIETSPGHYEVTDVMFTMPGTWEVRYRAEWSTGYDEAAFRYEVR